MTTSNIELVLVQISAVAVVAAPVGLLLLSGYIDFAVGSTAGLAGAVMGLYLDEQGGNPAIGVLIAIAVGAAVGAVQGALATKLTLSPIIITLGFYTAVRGLVFVVSDGEITNRFGESFQDIGRGEVPGHRHRRCRWSIAAGRPAAGWLFHTRTKWGRHVVSLGVNAEAARRAGISLEQAPVLLLRRQRGLCRPRCGDHRLSSRRRSTDARRGARDRRAQRRPARRRRLRRRQGIDRRCRGWCAVHRLPQQRPAADGRAAVLDPGQLRPGPRRRGGAGGHEPISRAAPDEEAAT